MSRTTKWLLIIAGILTVIAATMPLLIRYYNPKFNVEQLGTMGDWMGGTMTPILNLVGTILILVAFLAQREELELNRKEFELNREEMERSRKEIEQQNDTLVRQRFENSFFQLISILRDVVDSFEYRVSSGHTYQGRHGFMYSYNVMKGEYPKYLRSNIIGQNEDGESFTLRVIRDLYVDVYNHNKQFLGHYFRNLYHTVNYIDRSEFLTAEDKQEYIRILRAQLSVYEMSWLFYNAINEHGYPTFYKLIVKYDLLQNMDKTTLFDESHLDIFQSLLV